MMRTLELQRLIEDKVSEWRARSARVSGTSVADSYQQPLNFKRHTNRRKNSAEINRIIAKYSKPNKRADERYCTAQNIPEKPPTRPPRLKKFGLKVFSKSEDNLANIMDTRLPSTSQDHTQKKLSKYNTKSYEDITAFVDIDQNVKSKNFAEKSIMNAKTVPKNIRPKLHSINEDLLDYSVFSDNRVGGENKTSFATSTPLSLRKSCPPISDSVPVNGFEKCTNYNSVNELRKGISEPDILSCNISRESLDIAKSLDSKKRWSLLKPSFNIGALNVIRKWRGKKQRNGETDGHSRR